MLNMKNREYEEREIKVRMEKDREKRYSVEFQSKLEKIKKDSEEGIKKII